MKQDIKITGMKGNLHMPIYNFKRVESIIADIDRDIAEVEEEMEGYRLINREPDMGLIFHDVYLRSIKHQYQEINSMICN